MIIDAYRFGTAPGPWTPGALSPFGWWNDDSSVVNSGGAATQWNDIGIAASRHLVQASGGTSAPTINATGLNSRRTLSFFPSAPEDYLNEDSGLRGIFQDQTAGWVFAVVRRLNADGAPTARNLFVSSNGTDGSTRFIAALGAGSANTPALLARRLDGDGTSTLNGATGIGTSWVMVLWLMDWSTGDGFVYLDGDLDASNTSFTSTGNTSNTNAVRSVCVGGYPGNTGASPGVVNPMDAELAELVASRGLLSGSDIDKLFGYAAHRWGLAGSLDVAHPYKSAPP